MKKPNVFKEFIKDKNVASVSETSKHIVEKICNKIDFSEKKIIVEYGPGTGVFTKYLLEKMNQDSKIIIIETNKEFVENLNKINDPRLIVVYDSAENVQDILKVNNLSKVDYIISGVPFSFMSEDDVTELIKRSRDILNEDGGFFVYQVSSKIEKYLKDFFPHVSKDFALNNIPPLHVYEARK
ncbi:methyltransferase domain-containing protein [Candidatus Pacearchaeota archaeon]|nr:methyltransferase domain-containing protein [Candidatus Pacearchaeota archaeon]